MKEQELLELLEEIMYVDEGTLEPDTELADMDEWDSLTKLSLIATAKQRFKKTLTADIIKGFETVADIIEFFK